MVTAPTKSSTIVWTTHHITISQGFHRMDWQKVLISMIKIRLTWAQTGKGRTETTEEISIATNLIILMDLKTVAILLQEV